MIAVDTNVLVRYLTNDDADQARKAAKLLAGADAILVPHTVLLELAWVLRSVYDLSPRTIHMAMLRVLGLPNVHIENAERIAQALSCYEQGMDFADALHLALSADADRLVTFDQRFARSLTTRQPPVELL